MPYAPLGGGDLDAEAFFNYPNKFEIEFDGELQIRLMDSYQVY